MTTPEESAANEAIQNALKGKRPAAPPMNP